MGDMGKCISAMDEVVVVGECMESEACQSTPLNCPPLLKPDP